MCSKIITSRQAAFIRQDGRCYYCNFLMLAADDSGPHGLRCTAEHRIAKCLGGSNGIHNIVAACLHCNRTRHRAKHPLDAESYRAYVRRKLSRGRWHVAAVWAYARRMQDVAITQNRAKERERVAGVRSSL
jgi:hypothetical protein